MIKNTNKLVTKLQKMNKICNTNNDTRENNRTVCRLLKIQLREFFDDIYIPYHYFKNNDWNISKILYDNEDSLFYNKKYLTKEDEERFHCVFSKYITMLEEIFNPDNKLLLYLKSWTDTSGSKWKTNHKKSYLKSILIKRKYQIISPSYITYLYCDHIKKFKDDPQKCKEKFEQHLDSIIAEFRKECKNFQAQYNEIVESYVYEHPLNYEPNYMAGFINSVLLAIIDFSEKMVDLNIYAIHPIITQFVEYYTPLDEINSYKSYENDGKKMCIV